MRLDQVAEMVKVDGDLHDARRGRLSSVTSMVFTPSASGIRGLGTSRVNSPGGCLAGGQDHGFHLPLASRLLSAKSSPAAVETGDLCSANSGSRSKGAMRSSRQGAVRPRGRISRSSTGGPTRSQEKERSG